MSKQEHALFQKHSARLHAALQALRQRSYWAAFQDSPNAKTYGEGAMDAGARAFKSLRGTRFVLDQPGQSGWAGAEISPYSGALEVQYPVCAADALLAAGQRAMLCWQAAGLRARLGLCLEMVEQLNAQSFLLAHAVMHTTGQGWMMAFQAGAAHAQERALEALACAYAAQSEVPGSARWAKPLGRQGTLLLEKRFELLGRGPALVLGCSTFPTWNTYPGLFAALATGNSVIVKPHENAILPAALTVRALRATLAEWGLDADLVTLFVPTAPEETRALATHSALRSIDYTGSSSFGRWLQQNCRHAQVYAELAGVNCVVLDSTDDYAGMLRNLAFSLALYSGQMCTTPQTLFVPETGLATDQGCVSFAQVCADLVGALQGVTADASSACAVLGAIQSNATLQRIALANSGALGEVLLPSRPVVHAQYPQARVQTPVLLRCAEALSAPGDSAQKDSAAWAQEQFGPISFVVRAPDSACAIAWVEHLASTRGALGCSLYSTRAQVLAGMTAACWRAKVALSVNLTGPVHLNQSAAFSDFHGTGANPAGNAAYTDLAFVAQRFCVVQQRTQAAVGQAVHGGANRGL